MITHITNIKGLINVRQQNSLIRGRDLKNLPCIEGAFLIIEKGKIRSFGLMEEYVNDGANQVIDAAGQFVLPSWCDSHTHIVFAGSREKEFVDKIKGLTYAEIAANGGGILNSALLLNHTSEEELYETALERLQYLMLLGTGAIEIKSGYGLSLDSELKMLRVIKRLKENTNVIIKSTFLGAHTFPLQFKDNREKYIDVLITEMLPAISKSGLADYIDVFCETGFFTPNEMEIICRAGEKHGLRPKLHINQLNSIGGLQKAIELNALSVDHLENMTSEDIHHLSQSNTIGTLLPTAAFFLRMPYQPARALIDNDCAIALASDYNPGSSPSGNMNFVLSLSCIQMKMLPEEAINAATINGAYAMGIEEEAGSITIGKTANLIITKPMPSLSYLPYAFGSNLIDKVLIKGEILN